MRNPKVVHTALVVVFAKRWLTSPSPDAQWGWWEVVAFLLGTSCANEQEFRAGADVLVRDAYTWHTHGLISDDAHAAYLHLQAICAYLYPSTPSA